MLRKFFATIILLTVLTTAALSPLVVYGAKKSSSSSSDNENEELHRQIEEDEGAISDAESEKSRLNSDISNVESIISSLETRKGNLESYVTQLDSSLAGIQSEISGLNDKIDELDKNLDEIDGRISDKEGEIETAAGELEIARQELKTQYDDTRQHIKYMYETRNATILDLILHSEGIKDLLNRAQYVLSMTEYDKGRLEEYAAAVEAVEEKKKKLLSEQEELGALRDEAEGTKAEINGEKEQVKAREADVTKLISAKEQEINAYNADISSKEEQIAEYRKMIAGQDAIIRSLESAIAARKAQLQSSDEGGEEQEESSLPKYDGGKFTFPCPGYTRISDDYGNRMHPILNVERFHNGVDLAAPSGTPILAAYSGTVIAADYSASMGNYVMIDHGDEVYTIYMHASSLLVSTGATVGAGQKIALVGSTGRSTGPHLHFSVRENGSYVSPWKYLK